MMKVKLILSLDELEKARSISSDFIFISRIKPVKDETTGGAAPIRSVLQPWITVNGK